MANLKDIKSRIGSVKKTKQITQAMKLVAAAKLKGASDRATAAQPYQAALRDVLSRVAAKAGGASNSPLLRTSAEVKRVLLVVLTSDRGLCGGFNNNMLRRLVPWIEARQQAGVEVVIEVFGRKGRDYLRNRGFTASRVELEWAKQPKMSVVKPLTDRMVAAFTSGDYDEVYVGYNAFKSAANQVPTTSQVLPLAVDPADADGDNLVDYIYEPQPQQILNTLLPLYLGTLVLQSFLETEAGEHAARMLAMDAATRNASDLIGRLTLEYNRARQAAITKEIIEIVSGAEAL